MPACVHSGCVLFALRSMNSVGSGAADMMPLAPEQRLMPRPEAQSWVTGAGGEDSLNLVKNKNNMGNVDNRV